MSRQKRQATSNSRRCSLLLPVLALGFVLGIIFSQIILAGVVSVRSFSTAAQDEVFAPKDTASLNVSVSSDFTRFRNESRNDDNSIIYDLRGRISPEVDLPIPVLNGHLARHGSPQAQYSSMSCLGDINHIGDGPSSLRNCHFKNICFKPKRHNWIYHEPQNVAIPKLFESKLGHIDSFYPPPFIKMVNTSNLAMTKFSPILSRMPIPANALMLNGTFVLHVSLNAVKNLGHDVWESLFAIYNNLVRFGIDESTRPIIILPHEFKIRENFKPLWGDVGRAVTDFHPLSVDLLHAVLGADGKNPEYSKVCVESLIPAQITEAFTPSLRSHLWGQEAQYRDFRRRVLEVAGVDSDPQLPSKPLVVITKKSHSYWADIAGQKCHRCISNLDDLVVDLRKLLPRVAIQVQEWHKIDSWKEQLELLGRTSILVSPAGGVSMNGPFLPNGASIVLMDYLASSSDDNDHQCNHPGESCSMEATFWSMFSHLTTLYYQVRSPAELTPDGEPNQQYRNHYSVIVNSTRLVDLIRPVLVRQGYEEYI